jgi:hypothetical protein
VDVKLGQLLREIYRLRLFENRVLRRISGPKTEELAAVWRRLHSEELHNLCASQNIIRVTKLRNMRWSEHVDIWERREMPTKFWSENINGRGHSEDLGVYGMIIFNELREAGWERVNQMHMARDGDQWRTVVDTTMKFFVA